MNPTAHDPLLAAVSEFAAAVTSAIRADGRDDAETLRRAEAVVAARLNLYTRLIELGWTPPPHTAATMRADKQLLRQPGGQAGG